LARPADAAWSRAALPSARHSCGVSVIFCLSDWRGRRTRPERKTPRNTQVEMQSLCSMPPGPTFSHFLQII
jgi:hypothetical protein